MTSIGAYVPTLDAIRVQFDTIVASEMSIPFISSIISLTFRRVLEKGKLNQPFKPGTRKSRNYSIPKY